MVDLPVPPQLPADVEKQRQMQMFIDALGPPKGEVYTTYDDSNVDNKDYIGTINRATTHDNVQDESRPVGEGNRDDKLLGADDDVFDETFDPDKDENQAPSPLEELIPKMASGNATKEDMMRFYKLTGRAI